MTRQEFEAALDRYGPDLSRWPERLGDEAAALIGHDAAAAGLLADAERLRRILAEAVRPVPVDAALVGTILTRIDRPQQATAVALRATPRLAAVASIGLIAALAVGFTAGYLQPSDTDDTAVAALVFAGEDPGVGL
jgi:hypothetical protein